MTSKGGQTGKEERKPLPVLPPTKPSNRTIRNIASSSEGNTKLIPHPKAPPRNHNKISTHPGTSASPTTGSSTEFHSIPAENLSLSSNSAISTSQSGQSFRSNDSAEESKDAIVSSSDSWTSTFKNEDPTEVRTKKIDPSTAVLMKKLDPSGKLIKPHEKEKSTISHQPSCAKAPKDQTVESSTTLSYVKEAVPSSSSKSLPTSPFQSPEASPRSVKKNGMSFPTRKSPSDVRQVSSRGIMIEKVIDEAPETFLPRVSSRPDSRIYESVDDLYKFTVCVACGDIAGVEQEMATNLQLHKRKFEDIIPMSFVAIANNQLQILLKLFQSGDLQENHRSKVKIKWRLASISQRRETFWIPEDIAFERRGIKWLVQTKLLDMGSDIKACAAKFGVHFEDNIAAWCRGSMSIEIHLRDACISLWNFLQTVESECGSTAFLNEFDQIWKDIQSKFNDISTARENVSQSFKKRMNMEYPLTLQLILEINDAMESYNAPQLPSEEDILALKNESCLNLVNAGSSFQEIMDGIKKSRQDNTDVQNTLQKLIDTIDRVEVDFRKWSTISQHRSERVKHAFTDEKSNLSVISSDHISRVTRTLNVAKFQWEKYQEIRQSRLDAMAKLEKLMIEEREAMDDFHKALSTGLDAWDDCADAAAVTSLRMKSFFNPKHINSALTTIKRKKRELDIINIQNDLYERFLMDIDIRSRAIMDLNTRLHEVEQSLRNQRDSNHIQKNYLTKLKKAVNGSLSVAKKNVRALVRSFFGQCVKSEEDKELLKACISARLQKMYEEVFYENGKWIEEDDEKEEVAPSSEDNRPPEFLCPITGKIMSDPVIYAVDGKTYERKAIEEFVLMNQRGVKADFSPNERLATRISEYKLAMKLIQGATVWWKEERYSFVTEEKD